jgi:hypothetical protein
VPEFLIAKLLKFWFEGVDGLGQSLELCQGLAFASTKNFVKN